MAKKEAKKKNFRLRRRIRRTLGAICLITALLVAAIPVPETRAAAAAEKFTWDKDIFHKGNNSVSEIPTVPSNYNQIYTYYSGNATFVWAFVNVGTSTWVAVILGYRITGQLEDATLTIPDTVDAYALYNENIGDSNQSHVAVGRNFEPLYYISERRVIQEASGNDPELVELTYSPCTYGGRSNWENLKEDEFYYRDSAGNYHPTSNSGEQWIKGIPVVYIGNQSVITNSSTGGSGVQQEWVIAQNSSSPNVLTTTVSGVTHYLNNSPDNGVFANQTNIQKLVVGGNLIGIGNYAFYNCTELREIVLSNSLVEIGKNAFQKCRNLQQVGFGGNSTEAISRLTYISDYAFAECESLTSFSLTTGITKIFDHAFDSCTSLKSVALSGAAGTVGSLSELGCFVFANCTALEELTLPSSIGSNTIHLNNFQNCRSLKHVMIESFQTKLEADDGSGATDYTAESFLSDVHADFYFESEETSGTHDFTKENAIAFKYVGEDLYEIITKEESGARLTYQVNSKQELLFFDIDDSRGSVTEVEIPDKIGPFGISYIESGCFSGVCTLKKITIPATVTEIREDAFKGCHNLEAVIFVDATKITYIGSGAFATQVANEHRNCPNENSFLTETPVLSFTGAVGDNNVFNYAMDKDSNINAGAQPLTYITYYSGWPSNLEIRYVPKDLQTKEGEATLVDYPRYVELSRKYVQAKYPYLTDAQVEAAAHAVDAYEAYLNGGTMPKTDEWDLINASLNPSIPAGVKAIETGLFSGVTGVQDNDGNYEIETVSGKSPDLKIQSITFADIEEYEPYTFSGCVDLNSITITGGTAKIDDYAFAYVFDMVTGGNDGTGSQSSLTTFNMQGGGSSIGNYAFCNNKDLKYVTISPEVSELGIRPFRACPALQDVNFSGGPYFTTGQSIIYGLKDGNRDVLVECLESRGGLESSTPNAVSPTELAGITAMMEEAFMDCVDVTSVDMTATYISGVPENAFKNTRRLNDVELPTSCRYIRSGAFSDSYVSKVSIPDSVTNIAETAFNTYTTPNSSGTCSRITFYCNEDSTAADYASERGHENIQREEWDGVDNTVYKVYFLDDEDNIIEVQDVIVGNDATPPTPPVKEGKEFVRWLGSYTNIHADTTIYASYRNIDSDETKYLVEFFDYTSDEEPIQTYLVAPGEDAPAIVPPAREGYTFVGWRPAITNIQSDTKTYAQYERGTGTNDPNDPNNPNNPNDPNNPNGGNGSTLYTLTVRNGSGSGSYVAGATVIIIANNPASSQQFSKWTTDNDNVKFASSEVAATTIVMPAENATVTANFVAGSTNGGSGTGNGNGNGNGSNSGSSTSGNGTNNNNTGSTVVIDKYGLSNTGVVSVTIRGSSDNFVVKISEDQEATESVLRALMEEYGSLDNVKYFPMDISLYDSTGKTKITDTSGLKIEITLPIPDSLITYGGNNMVAGVVNDRLDKLSPRFTTIDGVACVTFTAEHFSPYVIYVKTDNLQSNGVADSSPKTGDIHPKWFAVIALCCISVVLFVKKDKTGKKVLVKA